MTTIKEVLKLNPSNLTDEEILIGKAECRGAHTGIKMVIKEIEQIERHSQNCGIDISDEFTTLKNKLGVLVYANWPNKD